MFKITIIVCLLMSGACSQKKDSQPKLTQDAPVKSEGLPSRESQFRGLKNSHFDILIIGGGATGAGAALDAASRGLSVLLIENCRVTP